MLLQWMFLFYDKRMTNA